MKDEVAMSLPGEEGEVLAPWLSILAMYVWLVCKIRSSYYQLQHAVIGEVHRFCGTCMAQLCIFRLLLHKAEIIKLVPCHARLVVRMACCSSN
jgi:hypothetical protein